MIGESYTLQDALRTLGEALLKLILDLISAYPLIIVSSILILILGVLGVSIFLVIILIKWIIKFLQPH